MIECGRVLTALQVGLVLALLWNNYAAAEFAAIHATSIAVGAATDRRQANLEQILAEVLAQCHRSVVLSLGYRCLLQLLELLVGRIRTVALQVQRQAKQTHLNGQVHAQVDAGRYLFAFALKLDVGACVLVVNLFFFQK